jgi:hypothetical protein
MHAQLLSQESADALMKSLRGIHASHFYYAFHVERNHVRKDCWALPPARRLYYRVESYLFGVNWQNRDDETSFCLSSFARVDAARPRGTCALCLHHLLDEALAPLGHALRKTRVVAALNRDGNRVFDELQALRPGVTHGSGEWGFGAIELAPRNRPDDRSIFDELTAFVRR